MLLHLLKVLVHSLLHHIDIEQEKTAPPNALDEQTLNFVNCTMYRESIVIVKYLIWSFGGSIRYKVP